MLTFEQRKKIKELIQSEVVRRAADLLVHPEPWQLSSQLFDLRVLYDEVGNLPILETVAPPPAASAPPEPSSTEPEAPAGGGLEAGDSDLIF